MNRFQFLVCMLLTTATTIAQTNELSLLNGRFSFVFPDSAQNQSRAVDIMSADPNNNMETRVVFDIGPKRIVFFAEDLLMRSAPDMEKKLQAESTDEYPLTVQKKDYSDSTTVYTITPQKFNEQGQAILINSLIIKNPDNTLSRVRAYINPEAFKDKPTFDKIATDVFLSFREGSRRLDLSAKTETFSILKTKTLYKIKLPENYVVTVDKKYDFEVYKVKEVTAYAEENFAEIIIYFGFYPSLVYKDLELEDFKTKDSQREYMFHNLTWTNYQDKKRNLFLREQIFVDDDIQKDAQNHIAMIASSEKKIEELARIIKNSLLVYDK